MFDYSNYKVVKDTNHFSLDKLANPDVYLWPGFFWVINDKLDKEKLREQLQDMYDHGAKSVCIHTEPIEMGKEISCDSLLDDVKYLSKEYMEYVEYISETCDELGMHLWLYDEAGWPSGTACGQVYARNPKAFEKKELTYDEFTIGKNEKSYKVPEGVLYAGVFRDGKWVTSKPGEILNFVDGDSLVKVFYIKTNYNDQWKSPHTYDYNFANLLNKEVTETFIQLSHERIKEHIGQQFGKNMFFTFTDEPGISTVTSKSIPWVDDFDDFFQANYGYSILDFAPSLLAEESSDEGLEVQNARVDLFDCLSKLFVERYLEPIQKWCHENGMLASGHPWQDATIRAYAVGGSFHLLRWYRASDMPAIDYIFREYFPGRTPVFAKYASSIARQKGVKYTMTESFCLAGNGITLGQMKTAIDQQYLRGCNMLVMGVYPYSTREHLMSGERPHYGPVNPFWKYQDMFHEYAARLSYMLSRGESTGNAAVYVNYRDIWAGAETRNKAYDSHEKIYRALYKRQIDFDFIDDDVLSGKEGSIEGKKLIVGVMEYDTIIVPESDWIESGAMKGLAEFANNGGRIIIVGKKLQSGGKSDSPFDRELNNVTYTTEEQLASLIEPIALLEQQNDDIRITKRVLGDMKIYFVFNESANKIGKTKITFNETSTPVISDIETAKLVELKSDLNGDKTLIDLAFEPWESKVILFGAGKAEVEADTFIGSRDKLELDKGWKLRPVKQYQVGLHDFETIEKNQSEPFISIPGMLKDWSKQLGQYYSGEVEYIIQFDCPEQFVGRRAMLQLGEVSYACEAFLNDQSLGRKAWGPFSYRLDHALKKGSNQIAVKVTNTLANAILSPEAEAIWDSKVDGGRKKGRFWDEATKALEKDSLVSGLLGPVKIVFE